MNVRAIICNVLLLSASLPMATDGFPRKILLENFTTSDCINCPRGHDKIETSLKNVKGDVVWVCHHSGYTTRRDPYPIDASDEYIWFYGGNGTYAPAMMINRHNFSQDLPQLISVATPVMDTEMAYVSQCSNHAIEQGATVFVNINKQYDEASRLLTLTVSGKKSDGFLLTNPVLNIFLTEDSLVSYQNGAGTKYRHDHVIRDNLTAVWGDPIAFDDDSYSMTYQYTVDEEWKDRHVQVIAFVANYDPANRNNCSVENVEAVPLLSLQQPAGITTHQSSLDAPYQVLYSMLNGRILVVRRPDGTTAKILHNQ